MDRVTTVFVRARLPTFSIKHPESFQVMSCLPIPQPSTLVGALGYCIGVHSGVGTDVMKKVIEWVKNGYLLVARARLYLRKGQTLPVAISPVVLRRFRIVDKAHEKKKKGETTPIDDLYNAIKTGNYVAVKRLVEVKLMDAFYRDYIMGHEVLCVWVFKESLKVSENIFWLMQRLGDTESLISVLEVWSEKYPVSDISSAQISFPVEVEYVTPKEGDFLLIKMCDETRILKQYLVPIKYEIKRTKCGKVVLLSPTEVNVEFIKARPCCKTDEGIIPVRGRP